MAKIEARPAFDERRADHLGFAFQLVAAALARLDPRSDILRRALMIIEGVRGVFTDGATRVPPAAAETSAYPFARATGGPAAN